MKMKEKTIVEKIKLPYGIIAKTEGRYTIFSYAKLIEFSEQKFFDFMSIVDEGKEKVIFAHSRNSLIIKKFNSKENSKLIEFCTRIIKKIEKEELEIKPQ